MTRNRRLESGFGALLGNAVCTKTAPGMSVERMNYAIDLHVLPLKARSTCRFDVELCNEPICSGATKMNGRTSILTLHNGGM